MEKDDFDLQDFLPYLLNQAAEASSFEFQPFYKAKYGMLRMEWRVLFHLGRYGAMTAKDICERASIHKTKVSRAVSALEAKRFLKRATRPDDRRHEILDLTKAGQSAFADLYDAAQQFEQKLTGAFSAQDRRVLRRCLKQIAGL